MCFEHINRLITHHENHEILTLRVLRPLLQSWMARAWHPSVFLFISGECWRDNFCWSWTRAQEWKKHANLESLKKCVFCLNLDLQRLCVLLLMGFPGTRRMLQKNTSIIYQDSVVDSHFFVLTEFPER